MPAILVNYNYTPDWLERFPQLGPVTIYDRSDDGAERDLTTYGGVYRTQNIGDVDCDKLSYLIDNYDNLPDVFLWSKSNLFKFITEEEYKEVAENLDFTPLFTLNHRIYSDEHGPANKYEAGIYKEANNNWIFNSAVDQRNMFRSWHDWAQLFMLPEEQFIPFAPGGSYILTKERVHRYSRDYYEMMRSMLPYAKRPVEAHLCERSYWYMWH